MPERSTAMPRPSVYLSFVVQFGGNGEGDGGAFSGRAEHVMSDRATYFASTQDLLAFFDRVLSELERRPDDVASGSSLNALPTPAAPLPVARSAAAAGPVDLMERAHDT